MTSTGQGANATNLQQLDGRNACYKVVWVSKRWVPNTNKGHAERLDKLTASTKDFYTHCNHCCERKMRDMTL